jgi:phosphoglycolate phosphatase
VSAAPGRADLFEDIDLAVFDKDGTLIHFTVMWLDWAHALAARVERELRAPFEAELLDLLGVDRATGGVTPHGLLAATPMKLIRELVLARLIDRGVAPSRAAATIDEVWRPPDPVALARPVTDLRALFGGLRAGGCRVAVATADDRDPTLRTLRALRIDDLVDAVSCADDGHPIKPAPDGVFAVCAATGVPPGRAMVIGDSPADLWSGRNAGAGRVVGVLTGVSGREVLAPLADVVLGSIAELTTP